MFDNIRAVWNSAVDGLSDPGKLAQLSVSDLEKSIRKAKETVAPLIGRPAVLESKIKDLQNTDSELTKKIVALLKAGDEGQQSAKKHVERQVAVRKEIEDLQEQFDVASGLASEWQDKIKQLEIELASRRTDADRLQAEYETAKTEQVIGKQMQSADSLLGSDTFSRAQSKVDKEKAKAAGYAAMSGLNERASDEKLIREAEADSLMESYLSQLDKEN